MVFASFLVVFLKNLLSMYHHALAPVSLDPGDFWHSWELLFQSFSVGLTFIRMNCAQKPLWRHPLFHEKWSDTYIIYHFKDHPEGDIKTCSIYLFGEKTEVLKSIIPQPMDSKGTSALVSLSLATPSFWSALASSATTHPYVLWDMDQWPNLRNCWKCLRMESASPWFFRIGLVCLNSPKTNTPSGSRHLITSNKGRPSPLRSFQTRMFVSSEPERTNLPSGV